MMREPITKFIFPIIVIIVAGYFGWSFLQTPQQSAFILFLFIFAGVVLIKPLFGMLFYIAYLPFVKESGGLSAQEFMALGIIVLLSVLWYISRSKKWTEILEIHRIERSLVILFSYMVFSLLVGLSNGVTIIDWGRDLFPLLHLVLILPVIHFIDNEQDFRLAFYFFLFAIAYPIFLWFLGSLIKAGLVSHFSIYWLRGTPFAMYILIILGIVSFLEYRKIMPQYILPGVSALGIAILNHPRTVWLGSAISVIVLFILGKNKMRWMMIVFVGFIAAALFISYVEMRSPGFIDYQMHYLTSFQNLDEDLSWQSRVAEAEQTMSLFYGSPIYGVGLGYQYYFWRPFVRGVGPGYLSTNTTHSDSTNYLAKTGLIGVLILFYLFYNIIVSGIKFYNQSEDPDSRMIYLWVVAGVITALVICNSTPILQLRYNSSALAFLISLMYIRKKLEVMKAEEAKEK